MNTYCKEERECIEVILGLGVECEAEEALFAWEEMCISLGIE